MRIPQQARRRLLESYGRPSPLPRGIGDRIFRRTLAASFAASLGLGCLLLSVDIPPESGAAGRLVRKATLRLRADSVRLRPKPEPPEAQPEPEDLTQSPILAQPETTVPEEPRVADELTLESPPLETPPEEAPEPRRVYGLRRVFAKGLGSGSGGAGSIIAKRGNTLDKEPDSLEATVADLAGPMAPLSTVTSAPVLIRRIKPEYTKEMTEHGVEGTVRARLLVDADGGVKAVEVIEDIGYGSREAALTAFRQLRFEPAMREGVRVAVWIIMKYRFVLQG